MNPVKKIADFLLSSHLFIASAAACLVEVTYASVHSGLRISALTVLVFSSTLLIYNFHKISRFFPHLSFSPTENISRLKNIPALTKTMLVVSTAGIALSSFFIQWKIIALFLPLSFITFAYSIPFLQIGNKKKRLREIFLVKISTVAIVWSITTVIFPLMDCGEDPFTGSSLLFFAERFLFVLAICIPFEIRDMEQEIRWGNVTLPVRVGVRKSKAFALVALAMFVFLVHLRSPAMLPLFRPENYFPVSMYASAVAAAALILFSNAQRDPYYFRIFVDGTMHLQLIFILLFKIMV
ncbi:MAG: UbiA family prenyltransferase [Bacteroidetes bacterium]|nr:UbiA family prenyltransferase [Bacteroidota bacterium]